MDLHFKTKLCTEDWYTSWMARLKKANVYFADQTDPLAAVTRVREHLRTALVAAMIGDREKAQLKAREVASLAGCKPPFVSEEAAALAVTEDGVADDDDMGVLYDDGSRSAADSDPDLDFTGATPAVEQHNLKAALRAQEHAWQQVYQKQTDEVQATTGKRYVLQQMTCGAQGSTCQAETEREPKILRVFLRSSTIRQE
jgi:hypothetical protein